MLEQKKKKIEAKGLKHQEIQIDCLVEHPDKKLPIRAWVDSHGENPPLILSYDLYEEISHLRPLALELCKLGFNIYAFPMRGHQELKNALAFPSSLHRIALDLLQVTAWIRKQEKAKIHFLLLKVFPVLCFFIYLKFISHISKDLCLSLQLLTLKSLLNRLKDWLLGG